MIQPSIRSNCFGYKLCSIVNYFLGLIRFLGDQFFILCLSQCIMDALHLCHVASKPSRLETSLRANRPSVLMQKVMYFQMERDINFSTS